MTATLAITLGDILTAADRIRDHVIRTPVVRSDALDELTGTQVFLKCENLQHVGAFKARGACNAILSMTDSEAEAGVVAHSSGNHAAAVARAARIRGIPATIVMPHNSAKVKLAAVRSMGIEPLLCEPSTESRQAKADRVMARTGATFVHPFNDPVVMAGQGTAALEFLEQVPDLDDIIVPVGGGGLLSATLVAVHGTKPSVAVYGAEPEWADDVIRSLAAGAIQEVTRYDTVADGLRTAVGSLTFPIIQQLVRDILPATEDDIRRAAGRIIRLARVVAEPSAAVPLAGLMARQKSFAGRKVGIILTGGNIDAPMLSEVVARTD